MIQAKRFWEVAETGHDPAHSNQAVSNAILAVIAANAALCLFLADQRPRGESHLEAAEVLQRACRSKGWEAEGAKRARQVRDVLQHKSAAQYEGTLISQQAAARIMKQAERFLHWAEEVLSAPNGYTGAEADPTCRPS